MTKSISLIQRVQIASPCTASWDEMVGDEKSRFCSQCKLNVYNLSSMTEAEGELLIIAKEGKLCARIYRRYDGTVLTKDCPVGLRAIRRRLFWVSLRTAAAFAFILATAASVIAGHRSRDQALDLRFVGVSEREGKSPASVWPIMFDRLTGSMNRWLVTARQPVQQSFALGRRAPVSQAEIDAIAELIKSQEGNTKP